MGIWVSLFDYRMPPISFTISSLSLGFTAFSEQAWRKVKKFAGASSNRKLSNKDIFASIRNQKLGGGNGFPSHSPDPLGPKHPAFWAPGPPGPPGSCFRRPWWVRAFVRCRALQERGSDPSCKNWPHFMVFSLTDLRPCYWPRQGINLSQCKLRKKGYQNSSSSSKDMVDAF